MSAFRGGTLSVAGRHYVAGAADLVEDRAEVALPQWRDVVARRARRRLQVDGDRLTRDVCGWRRALPAARSRLLLDLGGSVECHLLIAQLVLLGHELALLVLQPGDVIGRLGDLSCQCQIEEDADQRRAEEEVGVPVRVQMQAFVGHRARDLHEATRAPSPACRDVLRAADRAEAAPGEYSGRCQDVCLICCCEIGAWRPAGDRTPGLGWDGDGVRFFPPPATAPSVRGGWPPPPPPMGGRDGG